MACYYYLLYRKYNVHLLIKINFYIYYILMVIFKYRNSYLSKFMLIREFVK